MRCLHLLDLFNVQVKDAKLGVIKGQGESELAQRCFNCISHEFYSFRVLKAYFPFFPLLSLSSV